jgi:hypothetical protein
LRGRSDRSSARRRWINPVNEISFLTWLLTDTTAIYPYRGGAQSRAFELKRNLVRAAIASTVAIRARIPDARFFHTDPVIYVATPVGDDALAGRALLETESQFEAWDLLHSGEFEPTVAVKERFHLVGANYYHSSQWEVNTRRPCAGTSVIRAGCRSSTSCEAFGPATACRSRSPRRATSAPVAPTGFARLRET